jgi:hypothetical protein
VQDICFHFGQLRRRGIAARSLAYGRRDAANDLFVITDGVEVERAAWRKSQALPGKALTELFAQEKSANMVFRFGSVISGHSLSSPNLIRYVESIPPKSRIATARNPPHDNDAGLVA